ncbi:hypothetical protein [Flavobacterium sp.]|jgi:hypothetical protein|uniref:hypothetical protein n=1 Tax=Flavobacterium sp. TaxID=239 RepID=UPI0022BDC1A1|nr:hypothetical protein [Flavobacterium sp.]MCZ8168823.1 hypothetical protein [Flavobacterium sp.]MCZ8298376.1 hypothetical protein [Flavobacterium sp.]
MRVVEIENYTITEVFVGDDERARGYIVTDKNNNEFLYFFDVDRTEFKLTSYDVKENSQQLIEQINLSEKWLVSDMYDFIKVINDGNIDGGPANQIQRIRYSYGSCVNGRRGVYQAHFFLGFQITDWVRTIDENSPTGQQATVGCNELYRLDRSISAN